MLSTINKLFALVSLNTDDMPVAWYPERGVLFTSQYYIVISLSI